MTDIIEAIEARTADINRLITQRMSEIEKYRSTLQEIAEITSDPKVERLARAALEDISVGG